MKFSKSIEGNRKLVVVVLFILSSTILAAGGVISGSDWLNFAEIIFGAFTAGNGIEHVAKAFKKK